MEDCLSKLGAAAVELKFAWFVIIVLTVLVLAALVLGPSSKPGAGADAHSREGARAKPGRLPGTTRRASDFVYIGDPGSLGGPNSSRPGVAEPGRVPDVATPPEGARAGTAELTGGTESDRAVLLSEWPGVLAGWDLTETLDPRVGSHPSEENVLQFKLTVAVVEPGQVASPESERFEVKFGDGELLKKFFESPVVQAIVAALLKKFLGI